MSENCLLLIGCGKLATALAQSWAPDPVVGMRRSSVALPFPVVQGDAAEAATWDDPRLPIRPAAILSTATPGLRGGGAGNNLAQAHELVAQRYPEARVVYTASTAVYGDHKGAVVDEHTPLSSDGRSPALQRIEAPIAALPRGLVLRVGAIVGPNRMKADLSSPELQLRGDPQRPFPFIHEADLLQVLGRCLSDPHAPNGVLNAVAPHQLTYEQFYRGMAQAQGFASEQLRITGDNRPAPSRRVRAQPLWDWLGEYPWRLPWE